MQASRSRSRGHRPLPPPSGEGKQGGEAANAPPTGVRFELWVSGGGYVGTWVRRYVGTFVRVVEWWCGGVVVWWRGGVVEMVCVRV